MTQFTATLNRWLIALVQDCSNSTANALELLQSCTKPSLCITRLQRVITSSILFYSSTCKGLFLYPITVFSLASMSSTVIEQAIKFQDRLAHHLKQYHGSQWLKTAFSKSLPKLPLQHCCRPANQISWQFYTLSPQSQYLNWWLQLIQVSLNGHFHLMAV